MADEELACAWAYLTPVPTCEISTSTRNGKSFFYKPGFLVIDSYGYKSCSKSVVFTVKQLQKLV